MSCVNNGPINLSLPTDGKPVRKCSSCGRDWQVNGRCPQCTVFERCECCDGTGRVRVGRPV